MNVYVYPTDRDWYDYLSRKPELDEVNFWRPGGVQPFRQLDTGDLFLFRLKSPDNAIAGGGFFAHFSFAPLFQAWEAFGDKNGTPDYLTFLKLIGRHRRIEGPPDQASDLVIGCIVLTEPFFLPINSWLPVPSDYEVNSPQGQRYPADGETGRRLIAAVSDALRSAHVARLSETSQGIVQFGQGVRRWRLGQGAFSLVVSDAYDKRCAITGERTLPVLQAAHIVPVSKGGMHRPDNGLLLRSDIHTLFDKGYVTITPEGRFHVADALRADWSNGKVYYDLDGRAIREPRDSSLRPAREFLEWHNEAIYRG